MYSLLRYGKEEAELELLHRKVMVGPVTLSQRNSSGNTYITPRVEYIPYYLIQLWRYLHYSIVFCCYRIDSITA